MSSFLRPRRGKQSTAASTLTASNPLKRGEIFFEVPTGGVGTGTGKLKMGDGSTAYANLPYFLSMDDSVVTFTDSSASSSWDNYSNYLANIKTGITLPTFFANTKNLLYQLCSKVTSLNNDLDNKIYSADTLWGKELQFTFSKTGCHLILVNNVLIILWTAGDIDMGAQAISNGKVYNFPVTSTGKLEIKDDNIGWHSCDIERLSKYNIKITSPTHYRSLRAIYL